MTIHELTCISCPLGCQMKVEVDDQGQVVSVTGNTCKRGEVYAKKEVTNPQRMVCSTVHLMGGTMPLVAVKTKEPVSKAKIFDVMDEVRRLTVDAPVHVGDTIKEDIGGTGVALVATQERAARR